MERVMARTGPNSTENGVHLQFEREIIRLKQKIDHLEARQIETGGDYSAEIRKMRTEYVSMLRKTYQNLSAWQTVQVARHPARPLGGDYIRTMVRQFVELHGDRRFGDDKAIRCGLCQIGNEKVMLVAQHKGRDTKEKIECNFGMCNPEGYRKALRAMKFAEKFALPVVALIDTPGAHPGIGGEQRGVAEAIARNLTEMSRLRTPIVCVVIGEGGSGGALGIGVGDRVAMFQYAYYSVISPEGCASILWRSGEKAPDAAEALKLTAEHLKRLGVVDEVIPEPLGGAHRDPNEMSRGLERYLLRTIRQLKAIQTDRLLSMRYERWRGMGKVLQLKPATPATPVTPRPAG